MNKATTASKLAAEPLLGEAALKEALWPASESR